jgi:hypothetical protein
MAEVCAMDKTEGFRSFKEGLNRKLLWEYWLAVKEHAWETFWGAGVVGIAFTIYTIYYAPARTYIPWAVVWAILVAGYYVWRADHVRLQQKIEVTRVRKHSWPHPDGGEGTQYLFEIVNKSEAMTIRGVRVRLQEVIPETENRDWLPIPLHLQHDNPPSGEFKQSFDLHPRETKNIDLFSTRSIGKNVAHIAHAVLGVDLLVPITGRVHFKVVINFEDVPELVVGFVLWLDENGVLQCEMEPATAQLDEESKKRH